jgi:hypothetical protein
MGPRVKHEGDDLLWIEMTHLSWYYCLIILVLRWPPEGEALLSW